MKLKFRFKIYCILCLALIGNNCFAISLNSQEEIDNFSSNFPDSIYISSLFIHGFSINNLNGLSQIRSIDKELSIYDTNITNLIGLENIESTGSLSIYHNNQLETIESISAIEFGDDNFYLNLYNNYNLETCDLDNICASLMNYSKAQIYGNKLDCRTIIEARENCGLNNDTTIKTEEFSDGFENWEDNLLLNWIVNHPDTISTIGLSYEKVLQLNEGNHAIMFRWDSLEYQFDEMISELKIKFSLKFVDYGFMDIEVEETNIMTNETSNRNIIHFTEIGDSSIFNLVLDHIKITNDSNRISKLKIFITPDAFITPSGDPIYLYPQFTIDKVELSSVRILSHVPEFDHQSFKVYPNPFNNLITISSEEDKVIFFKIFDQFGRLIYQSEDSNRVDTSQFQNGIYFVQINSESKMSYLKILKSN